MLYNSQNVIERISEFPPFHCKGINSLGGRWITSPSFLGVPHVIFDVSGGALSWVGL